MLSKLITRGAFLAIVGSMVWFSTAVDVPNKPLIKEAENKKENLFMPKEVKNFQDLKIYEKMMGCKFIFVNNLIENNEEKYDTDKLIENIEQNKQSYEGWWKAVAKSTFLYRKDLCTKGKVITLDAHANVIKNLQKY